MECLRGPTADHAKVRWDDYNETLMSSTKKRGSSSGSKYWLVIIRTSGNALNSTATAFPICRVQTFKCWQQHKGATSECVMSTSCKKLLCFEKNLAFLESRGQLNLDSFALSCWQNIKTLLWATVKSRLSSGSKCTEDICLFSCWDELVC